MKIDTRRVFQLLVLVGLLCHFTMTFAVPAYPFKTTVDLGNGQYATIVMKGDENNKYAKTDDGYTVLSNSLGWWYAELSESGDVICSKYRLVPKEKESAELKEFKKKCPKNIIPSFQRRNTTNRMLGLHSSNKISVTGKRRALVILMQFQDLFFSQTQQDYYDLFNVVNYTKDGAKGSVRDYYHFASQGQLDYISDVYGPYTSEKNMSYYGRNETIGGNDSNAPDLCIEAILNLPKNIDYSIYDNNGDGLVDNVHIVFAGYGEEAGGPSDAIWSHEYPYRLNLKNAVGVSFAGYSCTPELRGNIGTNISRIGVICHELGHALGAMDYYDTNYETGGKYMGTGKWDIMADGSWNDNGKNPPNFNPYVRSMIFGWNKQIALQESQHVTMHRMESDNAIETPVFRIDTGSEGDYFLIENRQQKGFDVSLPNNGLMIYHVHPNIDRFRLTNAINATHPQGLYPVCASGSNPSQRQYGNINSSGCTFPGSNGVTYFTPFTTPAAIAWNGAIAKVSLQNIREDDNGTISFDVVNNNDNNPDDSDETELPTDKVVVYAESFEQSQNPSYEVFSLYGKYIWCTYSKSDLNISSKYIPSPTDGTRFLMIFQDKENSVNESVCISQDINVDIGGSYVFSFELSSFIFPNGQNPVFQLYIEDEYGEYLIFESREIIRKWEKIEIPITIPSDMFKYKFYGCTYSGGIFLDNIKLYKEESTQIHNVFDMRQRNNMLYSISGAKIRNQPLTPGIYIINNRKVFIK